MYSVCVDSFLHSARIFLISCSVCTCSYLSWMWVEVLLVSFITSCCPFPRILLAINHILSTAIVFLCLTHHSSFVNRVLHKNSNVLLFKDSNRRTVRREQSSIKTCKTHVKNNKKWKPSDQTIWEKFEFSFFIFSNFFVFVLLFSILSFLSFFP